MFDVLVLVLSLLGVVVFALPMWFGGVDDVMGVASNIFYILSIYSIYFYSIILLVNFCGICGSPVRDVIVFS